jgi:uncharacterized LabA/DUF88 family protein
LLFVGIEKIKRTSVYVDGFNLYYGALKGTPYRWFDFVTAVAQLLPLDHEVMAVKYFTARAKPTKRDPRVAERQNVYLRALSTTHSHLRIIEGRFLIILGEKPSEKGSDVNLAIHLVNDAWLNVYDVAVVVSNDADLAGAISMVTQERKKPVCLIPPISNPDRKMSHPLQQSATFIKNFRKSTLAECQLPNPVTKGGLILHKPKEW